MSAFEEFNLTGFHLTDKKTKVAILECDYGDGYGDDALVGHYSGLRRWQLTCDALPDLDDYMVSSKDSPEPQTRAAYFQDFWLRHKAEVSNGIVVSVNQRFIITDPTDGKKYLVSFTEHELDLTVITAKLFTVGLEVRQRRVRGFNTLDDGSIGTDDGNPDEV